MLRQNVPNCREKADIQLLPSKDECLCFKNNYLPNEFNTMNSNCMSNLVYLKEIWILYTIFYFLENVQKVIDIIEFTQYQSKKSKLNFRPKLMLFCPYYEFIALVLIKRAYRSHNYHTNMKRMNTYPDTVKCFFYMPLLFVNYHSYMF